MIVTKDSREKNTSRTVGDYKGLKMKEWHPGKHRINISFGVHGKREINGKNQVEFVLAQQKALKIIFISLVFRVGENTLSITRQA